MRDLLMIITFALGGQHFQPCRHQLGAGTVNPAGHVVVNLSCLTPHLSPAAATPFSRDLASDWLCYLGDSGA